MITIDHGQFQCRDTRCRGNSIDGHPDQQTILSPQEEFPILVKWHLSLQGRHNGRDSISNHQPHDCILNRLFSRRSKKTSKLRVSGLCAGNSPVSGEIPTQMASNAENVSIWWRDHVERNGHLILSYLILSGSYTKVRWQFQWCSFLWRYLNSDRFWIIVVPGGMINKLRSFVYIKAWQWN